MGNTLGFQELSARLIRHAGERVRRGETSERALSRLTGYSQPHIHNVLKGSRMLMPELADRMLHVLGVPLLALLTQDELAGTSPPPVLGFSATPMLDGRLGGGKAFPRMGRDNSVYFLPGHVVAGAVNPAVLRVDDGETAMSPLVEPGDWILLDRSPAARRHPRFECVYALMWRERGYARRCRVVRGALVVVADNPTPGDDMPAQIPLSRHDVPSVVQGRICWIGRELPALGLPA